jgi:hypothetical protein
MFELRLDINLLVVFYYTWFVSCNHMNNFVKLSMSKETKNVIQYKTLCPENSINIPGLISFRFRYTFLYVFFLTLSMYLFEKNHYRPLLGMIVTAGRL